MSFGAFAHPCRKDTLDNLRAFLPWMLDTKDLFSVSTTLYIASPFLILFQVIGSVQVLCEILKSGPSSQAQVVLDAVTSVVTILESTSSLSSNTVVRKLKTKLLSRAALRLVPTRSELDQGVEVPEAIETILEQLFETLQDKVSVHFISSLLGSSVFRIPSFAGLPPKASPALRMSCLETLLIKCYPLSWVFSPSTLSLQQRSTTCLPSRKAHGMERVLLALKWPAEAL